MLLWLQELKYSIKLKKINNTVNKENTMTTNYYLLDNTASQMRVDRLNEAAAARLASLAQKAIAAARKSVG
jgi:hypothetical protein